MATSRRVQSDKRLQNLQSENRRLYQDVQNLEDGLMLHQRYQDVEDSGVRGLLRKEIGGSRWEHGGSGKLRTYKDTRDLKDPYNIENNEVMNTKKAKKTRKDPENKSRKKTDDTFLDVQQEMAVSEFKDRNIKNRENMTSKYESQLNNDLNSDKLSLLKTKVLEKVSTGVIKRKKNSGNFGETFDKKEDVMSKDSKRYEKSRISGKVVSSKDGRSGSLTGGKTYTVKRQNSSLKDEKKGQLNQDEKLINRKKERKNCDEYDLKNEKEIVKDFGTGSFSESNIDMSSSVMDRKNEKSQSKNISRQRTDVKIGRTMSLTDFDRKNSKMKDSDVCLTKKDLAEVVQNDSCESRTQNHELEVTTGRSKNIDSRENIKNKNEHMEEEEWSKFSQGEWTYELDYQPSDDIFSLTNNSKKVPQCNPDVKLWLRRLGLLEEEKYFKIFSENEIDMDELSELTYEQLKDMGVVAIGALNKILRGIAELKLDLKKQNLKGNNSCSSPKLKNSNDVISFEPEDHASSPTYEQNSLASHINFDFTTKRTSRDDSADGYLQNNFSSHKFSFVEPNYRFTPGMRRGSDTDGDEVIKGDNSVQNHDQSIKRDNDRTSQLCSSNDNARSGLTKNKQKGERSLLDLKGTNENLRNAIEKTQEKCEKSEVKTTKKNNQVVRERSLSRQNSAKGRKEDLLNKQSSRVNSANITSRESRKTQSAKSKQKKNEKNANKSVTKLTRSKSSDRMQSQTVSQTEDEKKKLEIMQLNLKQQKELEKKKQRDEMAARHQQREKQKDVEDVRKADTSENKSSDKDSCSNNNNGANIPDSEDVSESKVKQKAPVPVYRPRQRPASVRQSVAVPACALELKSDDTGKNLMSSRYKVSTRLTDKKDKAVKDIEKEIQNLQNMALSGEHVTMELVKDLQQRLEKIEIDMSRKTQSRSFATRSAVTPFDPKVKCQRLAEMSSDSNSDGDSADDLPLTESKQCKNIDPTAEGLPHTSVSMSVMNKKQLLKEIKKEKNKHRKQIKHLYSELQTIKHSDLLKTTELDITDISFDTADFIGQGAFSRVYKGIYQGSEVAVKQLKLPLSSHDRNYFAAEVNLLQDLRHPRVVLLIGVCTADKLPLMVLEYMARGSLYHRLHDGPSEPLDHAEYYRVAHDIALGMNYLHQHKPAVLHLDLKSMNVLICSNDRAKIADFGFSKFRHDADVKASAAKSKPLHSPPTWMAPELLTSGEITSKADVYSFGILLWEMLTRKQPYEGSSVFQILEKVRTNKRPEIPGNCPEELRAFIIECWHANPARRPSFKEILKRLENMAFPPEWQALFKEAGIPDEALEDVQSARTIISLVSTRLDMEAIESARSEVKVHMKASQSSRSKVKDQNESIVSERKDDSVRNQIRHSSSDDSKSPKSTPVSSMVTRKKEDYDFKQEKPDDKVGTKTGLQIAPMKPSPRPSPRPRTSLRKDHTETHRQGKTSRSYDCLIEELSNVQKGNLSRRAGTDRERYNLNPEKRTEIIEDLKSEKSKKEIAKNKSSGVVKAKLSPKLDVSSNDNKPKESSRLRTSSQTKDTEFEVETDNRVLSARSLKHEELTFEGQVVQLNEIAEKSESSKPVNLVVHIPKLELSDLGASHDPSIKCQVDDDVSDISTDSLDESLPTPRDSLEDFSLPDELGSEARDENLVRHANQMSIRSEVSGENVDENSQPSKQISAGSEDREKSSQDTIQLNTEKLSENNDESDKTNIVMQKNMSKSRQRYSASKNKETLFKTMHAKLTQNYGFEDSDSIPEISLASQTHQERSNNQSRNSIEAWVDAKKITETKQTIDSSSNIPVAPPTMKLYQNIDSLSNIPVAPPPPPIGYTPPPPPPPPMPSISGNPKTPSSDVKPYRAKTKIKKTGDKIAEVPAPKKTGLSVTPSVSKSVFGVKSVELKDQKEALQSISKPHPNQLQDLSQVSKGTIHSIAEILKKAVSSRRIALGEDLGSPPQSVASSWSCIDD